MPALSTPVKHAFLTRLAHVGLALAVVTQLVTSLVMRPEEDGLPGNLAFDIHEVAGLAALAFALLFWLAMLRRTTGTDRGLVFPWFSGTRRAALWSDIVAHLRALARLRLPTFDPQSPVAGAVHGLGLALMSAMALSGATYFVVNTGDPDAGGLVGVVMTIHLGLANLVWAYLIGHGALAALHHFTRHLDLREMWSLRPGGSVAPRH